MPLSEGRDEKQEIREKDALRAACAFDVIFGKLYSSIETPSDVRTALMRGSFRYPNQVFSSSAGMLPKQ
jgi:hypothetical protein